MSIETAKIIAMKRSPFFGTLLYNLPIVRTDKIQTLGVDGSVLHVNEKFWESYNNQPEMQVGLLMHEVGHLFLNHLWRGRKFTTIITNPNTGEQISLYNLAGDAVINLMITEEGFRLPNEAFLDEKYHGMTTEEVYQSMLGEVPKENLRRMIKGSFCEKGGWSKPNEKEQKTWARVTKQALEVAKKRGNVPRFADRLYEIL